MNRTFAALILTALGGVSVAANKPSPDRVIVHEWGTFTTVAGADGRAIEWLPLNGPTDLPCFVDHFAGQTYKIALADGSPGVYDYAIMRKSMSGKVRMETPVLYFYGSQPTTVNVDVRFPRGIMTEWYPAATVAQPQIGPSGLRDPKLTSTISWRDVRVVPSAAPNFPTMTAPSHYYAARETDASPVVVNGQAEKFLFYRGVAAFDVPITTVALAEGGVRIHNLSAGPIPAAILFENYEGKLGFRVARSVTGDVTLEDPPLTSDFSALRAELERTLVAQGLYEKEAKAMVETWRDSWFEEGTRVFYIVPQADVNAILPLEVTPKPAMPPARVFVGRMEVVNSLTANAVASAVRRNDTAALQRYGRFLGPITDRSPGGAQVKAATNAALASYVQRAAAACK
jgi:hypothetical protein